MYIFINNKFYRQKNAKVSALDHGLLYGDGIFETMRCYNGIVFKIDGHIKRLFHSAQLINLNIPLKKSQLKEAIYSAIKKNKLIEAYIRLTITRGTGNLGYDSACVPNVIIIAKKFVPYPRSIYEKGVSVITYNAERFIPEAKSISCLQLALAKKEAARKNCFDAILVNKKGCITEGTVSNIFFARKNELYTPKEDILKGVTRETVISLARRFLRIKETKIKLSDIQYFDECFLTNTSAEIIPVIRINNKEMKKSPGEITKKLMEEFRKTLKKLILS